MRATGSLIVACAIASGLAPRAQDHRLGFSFTNMARQAGLDARTVYGGQGANTYLIETTGSGAAAIDYDAVQFVRWPRV